MLKLEIPGTEFFDERKEEFITTEGQTLYLEHSLLSISKWESKWGKAFLGHQDKTQEETLDYIKCMTITQNVPDDVYENLTPDLIKQVVDYIQAPMTATHFRDDGSTNAGGTRETVTSELIYYWMIALNIPVEFQKWHLNRLLTLVRVCNLKNTPPKKMSKKAIAAQNHKLNMARRAALGSRG